MSYLEKAKAELAAVESLIREKGGVDGILRQFEKEGLGSIAKSWRAGVSHPITADQIQRAFGYEALQKIGTKIGLTANEVASKLSELLPKAVDNLSSRSRSTAGRSSSYWGKR